MKLGRLRIEEKFPFFASILRVATDSSFDIFSPLGKDLVKGPRDADDYDDTQDGVNSDVVPSVEPAPAPDIEDAVAEEHPTGKHNPCFELDGKQIYEARSLNQAFTNYKNTGSTDRLKHVANIQRYAAKSPDTYLGILERDPTSGENQVQMDSPWSAVTDACSCVLVKSMIS